ncbi:MAG: glutathione peroxidase [Polyangiaceae bacterium]|nr:glutathione peroxidase [Polyangiaceae bacterium]
MPDSFLQIPLRTLEGEPYSLAEHAGDVLLIVNVASACGFTPQYAGLEALYRKHKDQGFTVLGFPCNQFGKQEPGDPEAIRTFCNNRFQITFPILEKVDVNGSNAHPLYKALKRAAPGLLGTEAIKWNFTKFLVDRSGKIVKRFGPADTPDKLERPIAELLEKPFASNTVSRK